LIAQSQSGTGKTAAFVLAMLSRVDTSIQAPQAICLAPSRELARQLLTVIQNMSKYTKITSVALIKDAFKKQKGEVDYLSTRQPLNYHIIVGTPGIIMECLRRRGMIYTTKIKLFVLDEADNMLDQDGLGDQSIRIRK
jgi:ATP-dependent RNA helicase DDX19/DBP5